ncbi:hypothetical protein [Sphingomicrobium clamense]|uniref:Uncharacterized protein n=1 Tax=Sphingomicrobium clamense TaxID=2851013 RepID=A0ABS6V3P8_9SPHN|nr:hypothetical protein [Sphingomicrobium sp. B8]MBW0144182.1 hypothetical protein [Sphingomicrobium sp. B8]
MSFLASILFTLALQDAPPTTVVDDVAKCREISDPTERLACFDRAAGVLAQAQEADELVVIDRNVALETKRENFGRDDNLPKAAERMVEDVKIKEISESITEFALLDFGKYIFRLSDGSIWRMTDVDRNLRPRVGDSIEIKKMPLGGYMATIDGDRRGVRVKRN